MKALIKSQEKILGYPMTENQKKDFVHCIKTKQELRHFRNVSIYPRIYNNSAATSFVAQMEFDMRCMMQISTYKKSFNFQNQRILKFQ